VADLAVVGSVALDSVTTPFGKVREVLGGSATYFSCAASFFTTVRLVATVGDDFPEEHLRLLKERGVDVTGLQTSRGRTFRWVGEYGFDLNEARTIDTQLNVFADFKPMLPSSLKKTPFLFLANIAPELQLDVLRQMERPQLTALDTMNFWILLVNDGEARQLVKEPNLIKAAREILKLGPRTVVVKRGEYGAVMVSNGQFFFVPAYPLESVFDPTGAGDAFAGGFMGYIAAQGVVDQATVRRAIVYGSVMASFTVEDFSLNRLARLSMAEVERRYAGFQELVRV
jgi:sugar/nucleoside kinase (ribokinase family)